MTSGEADKLLARVSAGYPVIWVQTSEESRADGMLRHVFDEMLRRFPIGDRRAKRVVHWSESVGWEETWGKGSGRRKADSQVAKDKAAGVGLASALRNALSAPTGLLLVLRDPRLDDFLARDTGEYQRLIRDCCRAFPGDMKTLVIVAPTLALNAYLEREVSVLRLPLPLHDELEEMIQELVEANKVTDASKDQVEDAAEAARGLTTTEARNIVSLSLATQGGLDPVMIGKAKAEALQARSPALSVKHPSGRSEFRGHEALQEWWIARGALFTHAARERGMSPPRGVVLLGPSGTGKTLAARHIALAWGLPLIDFDVGAVLGGTVGASEQGMRTALEVAEAMAPCVLLIDEINHKLGGVQGSLAGLDSGVKADIFGTLLSWMQDKVAPVFVVATANTLDGLPPALLRKGRFDEIFFVDLPTVAECLDVLQTHMTMRGLPWDRLGEDQQRILAKAMVGFSQAEIEQVTEEAAIAAYVRDEGLPVADDYYAAVANTKPLSVVKADETKALREWAKARVRMASVRSDGI